MKTSGLICFFLAICFACQATVVTTTSCTILDYTSSPVAAQTDPTSCSVSYDNSSIGGGVTIGPASGTATAMISGTFSPTSLSFTGNANGFARGSATALASFNETASLLLDTPGPVRSGFITFPRLAPPFTAPPHTGEQAQLNVGSHSASCFASGCSGDLAVRTALASVTLPFTLGEEYLFSEALSAQAAVNSGTSIEFGGGGTINFSYFLTDADGNVVEPFIAATTPEPNPVSLCVAGVCFLALMRRRKGSRA